MRWWNKGVFSRWGGPGLLILMISVGCVDKQIDLAFDGDFSAVKNNKVITDYCQSCHIHKDFEPESHLEEVRGKYKRVYFRRTSQCRSCHYIERDWVYNTISQHTRFPQDANRGVFRKFEKKEMKKSKKD